jgi:hypothetical protein
MTVVIGMMTRDGMVLGADTEETGAFKRNIGKLPMLRTSGGHCLTIGGAGDAAYIDCMTEQLWKAFATAADPYDTEQVEEDFRPLMFQFYQDHVLTWPSEKERADHDVSFVIGATLRFGSVGIHKLWLAENGSLRGAHPYCSVGMGRDYANILLDQYYSGMSTVMGALLMIYTLMKVKQYVPYCGKNSQVWCVRGIGQDQLPIDLVLHAEEVFKSLEVASTEHFLVTFRAASDSSVRVDSDDIGRYFEKLSGQFRPIAKRIDEVMLASTAAASTRQQESPQMQSALRKLRGQQ